eukprot:gene13031-10085_t
MPWCAALAGNLLKLLVALLILRKVAPRLRYRTRPSARGAAPRPRWDPWALSKRRRGRGRGVGRAWP